MLRAKIIIGAVFLVLVSALAASAQQAPSSFDINVIAQQRLVRSAPYVRNLPSGAMWLDGDRLGYRCAWTFLDDPNDPGLDARVFFRRTSDYVPGVPTAAIFDRGMAEGSLDFFGNPGTGQQTAPPEFCGEGAPQDVYPSIEPGSTANNRPVITFTNVAEARVDEVRGYAVNPDREGSGADFYIFSTTPESTTVVFTQDGIPVAAAYYVDLDLTDSVVKTTNVDPPVPPSPTPPPPAPELECFSGTLVSTVDGHSEPFEVCKAR